MAKWRKLKINNSFSFYRIEILRLASQSPTGSAFLLFGSVNKMLAMFFGTNRCNIGSGRGFGGRPRRDWAKRSTFKGARERDKHLEKIAHHSLITARTRLILHNKTISSHRFSSILVY